MADDDLYLQETLARVRQRLLDQSLRNRLLNYRESARDVAVVDELPDQVYAHLTAGRTFYFDAFEPPEPAASDVAGNDDSPAVAASGAEGPSGAITEAAQNHRSLAGTGKFSASDVSAETFSAEFDNALAPAATEPLRPELSEPEKTAGATTESPPTRTLPQPTDADEPVAPEHRDNRLQTPFPEKSLDARLGKLFQQHRLEIEETGANPLHLAVGFLRWKDERDTSPGRIAPLVLLPVGLERERARGGGKHLYALRFEDCDLEANFSLAEKLRTDFGIDLPPFDEEFSPEAYLSAVNAAIASKTRDGWEIAREMALGLFRFRKQIMWRDLDPTQWPDEAPLLSNALVRRTLLGASSEDEPPGILSGEYHQDDPDAPDAAPHVPLVLDADNTQYAALVDALGAETGGLVIEGPPGTGKSQTIANLIAAAMAAGKRVLFIAEKMAALSVVHRRLEAVGLAPFCLEMHGLKTNKRDLLNDLQARIDLRPRSASTSSLDANHGARNELVTLSRTMREPVGPERVPLHEAVWRLESVRGDLPDDFRALALEAPETLTTQAYTSACESLEDFGREWAGVPANAHRAWNGFDASQFADGANSAIDKALEQFESAGAASLEWMKVNGVVDIAPSHDRPIAWLKLARASDAEFAEFPLDGDAALARDAIHASLIDTLGEQIQRLHRHQETVAAASRVFDCAAPEAPARSRTLHKHCDALIGEWCDKSISLSDLQREHENLVRLAEQAEQLPKLAQPTGDMTGEHPRTLDEFQALGDTLRDLSDGPPEIALHYEPCHLRPSAHTYLERARSEANQLEVLRNNELGGFEPRRARNVDDLARAVEAVRTRANAWFAVLSGEYRAARANIRSVMHDPGAFSRDEAFIAKLDNLVSYCRQREVFAGHRDYTAALGKLFAGIDTPWATLEGIIGQAIRLSERIGPENTGRVLENWDTHVAQSRQTIRALDSTVASTRQYLSSHDVPEILATRPYTEIARHLRNGERVLSQALEALDLSVFAGGASLEQAIEAARAHDRARQLEIDITSRPGFDVLFAGRWQGVSTVLKPIERTHQWIQSALQAPGMSRELLCWLLPDEGGVRPDGWPMLRNAAQGFHRGFAHAYQALTPFGKVNPHRWVGGAEATFDDFIDKLSGCRSNMPSLPLLRRIHVRTQQLRGAGCEAVVKRLEDGGLEPAQCRSAFIFSVYHACIQTKIAAAPRLQGFSRTGYEALRDRFASTDREDRTGAASEVVRTLLSREVPQGNRQGRVADYTDQHLITHEARKKQRHIPVRQLMQRAGQAVQSLKPCLFMSPMSVAQYLPPGVMHFDLVVMDEASQVRPEDALGALARGQRTIVVGDPKQLPPTAFFQGFSAEEENQEETVMDDVESILDVCLRQFPYRRLRWHYRSQHERLIQFSNERFYDGDLLIFPSPKQGLKEFGVHGHYVSPSSYRSGRNRVEAETVVANTLRHFQRHPRLSLGIATFGRKQQEEIQIRLDRARLEEPALDAILAEHEQGDEPLFVKNLENVQGDERDVIFISATYGPEKDSGVVMQRFGPINSDQGWRRLNVIATRARQRVEVFTSMRHTDIQVEAAPRGRVELRNYLEYALTGRISETGKETGREPDSAFEVAVARVVNQLGYETVPQVGVAGFFIDLGVKHPTRPGEFMVGIECDGAAYHSAKSVRDRDRLRQEVLEAKGWRIHRIWSTSWFHERTAEIERLKHTLDTYLEADRSEDRRHAALQPHHTASDETLEHFDEEVVLGSTQISDDSHDEIQPEEDSLESALQRFRDRNTDTASGPDRSCILNDVMIDRLLRHRPTGRRELRMLVPDAEYRRFAPEQLTLIDDVLDIVAEFG